MRTHAQPIQAATACAHASLLVMRQKMREVLQVVTLERHCESTRTRTRTHTQRGAIGTRCAADQADVQRPPRPTSNPELKPLVEGPTAVSYRRSRPPSSWLHLRQGRRQLPCAPGFRPSGAGALAVSGGGAANLGGGIIDRTPSASRSASSPPPPLAGAGGAASTSIISVLPPGGESTMGAPAACHGGEPPRPSKSGCRRVGLGGGVGYKQPVQVGRGQGLCAAVLKA